MKIYHEFGELSMLVIKLDRSHFNQKLYICYLYNIKVRVMISLPHWGRDKMDAVSQTTVSNAFSWMKMYWFRLKFHWTLFPRVQLTIFQHWFRWWLDAGQATSHYLKQWWLVYWRIYASLGLNKLIQTQRFIDEVMQLSKKSHARQSKQNEMATKT